MKYNEDTILDEIKSYIKKTYGLLQLRYCRDMRSIKHRYDFVNQMRLNTYADMQEL